MKLIEEKEDELYENYCVEKSEPLKDFMTHWLNDVEKIKLKPSTFSRKQNSGCFKLLCGFLHPRNLLLIAGVELLNVVKMSGAEAVKLFFTLFVHGLNLQTAVCRSVAACIF